MGGLLAIACNPTTVQATPKELLLTASIASMQTTPTIVAAIPSTTPSIVGVEKKGTATQNLLATTSTPVPFALPEGFDAEAYLPPVPLAGEGAVTFVACPNPNGLEDMAGFPTESAIDLINNFSSGDVMRMQTATDPSLWPLLSRVRPRSESVTDAWFDGAVRPAVESPYTELLASQCGETVVQHSWWAIVCPGPCKASQGEAVKSHYFFIARRLLLLWLYL
jgi:hypothetical protein